MSDSPHFWTVIGPDPDSCQCEVTCTCGYSETFDSMSDLSDDWYLGPCTAPPVRRVEG